MALTGPVTVEQANAYVAPAPRSPRLLLNTFDSPEYLPSSHIAAQLPNGICAEDHTQ